MCGAHSEDMFRMLVFKHRWNVVERGGAATRAVTVTALQPGMNRSQSSFDRH